MISLLFWFAKTVWADGTQNLLAASDPKNPVEIREQAFTDMVKNGSVEIQYLVTASLDTTQSTRIRWVAIRALGQIKGPQAQDVLMKVLHDPEPAIRTAAVSALGDFGKVEYVALIGRFLKDDAVIVRVAAAESLGKLKDPKAVTLLEQALKDPSNQYRGTSLWVRAHFVLALGAIQDKSAYPALLRCLSDADPRVVSSAVTALEQIAGFSLGDGRSELQEVEAWSRWVQNQIR